MDITLNHILFGRLLMCESKELIEMQVRAQIVMELLKDSYYTYGGGNLRDGVNRIMGVVLNK